MPRGRRRTELVMLLFALAVVLFAYGAAGLGLRGKLPSGLPTYIIVYALVVLAAHVAVRRFAPYADPLLLPLAALLNGLGIVMIYRLQESGRKGYPGNLVSPLMSTSTTLYQLVFTAVGIVGLVPGAGADLRGARAAALHLYARRRRPAAAGHPRGAAVQPQRGQRRQGLDQVRRLLDPARRVRPAGARGVLRRLPGGQAGRAGAGRAPGARHRPAAGARPGPGADRLGREPADPDLRDRHRPVGTVLRPVRGHALHRYPADVLAADRRRAVPRRDAASQPTCSTT